MAKEKSKLGYWIKDASDLSERDCANATVLRVEISTESRYKVFNAEAARLFAGEFSPNELLENFNISTDAFPVDEWSGEGEYETGRTVYGGSYDDTGECEEWEETKSFEINTYINFVDGYEPDLTDSVDLLRHAS